MNGRTAGRLAWGIAFGCFAMAAAGLVLLYLNRAAIVSFNSSNVFGLVAAVTFGALGGVVASRRHDRRHRTARGNDPGNDRDGRGLRGGPEAARGERTPRRDRVGEPGIDHTRYHSAEELEENGLRHVRDAIEVLKRKATPQELEDYKRFVLNLTEKVAAAHREGGESVSPAERAAIEEITASLGTA